MKRNEGIRPVSGFEVELPRQSAQADRNPHLVAVDRKGSLQIPSQATRPPRGGGPEHSWVSSLGRGLSAACSSGRRAPGTYSRPQNGGPFERPRKGVVPLHSSWFSVRGAS